MYPYWLLFAVWAIGAVQTGRGRALKLQPIFFIAAAILTTLLIGLRFEVGGDWGAYQRIYDDIYLLSLPAAMSITDPGYAAVNWLGAQLGLGVFFANLVCAALFMGGVARLAWKQPNPALAMLVATPYFIIVVAMGYTRQAAAIGLICFALADASERRLARLVALIVVATLLHKTAILMLPVVLVPVFRRNVVFGILGFIFFLVLAAIVLQDVSNQLLESYVQSDYDSQGAAIRIAMNVLAAGLFLAFRKKIDLPPFQKSFWITCAILALVSVAVFFVASASAGIDRFSLYLIPLQLILYSHIPQLTTRDARSLPSILIAVIAYSFLVQFVWLNYADNANYWLPYKVIFDA